MGNNDIFYKLSRNYKAPVPKSASVVFAFCRPHRRHSNAPSSKHRTHPILSRSPPSILPYYSIKKGFPSSGKPFSIFRFLWRTQFAALRFFKPPRSAVGSGVQPRAGSGRQPSVPYVPSVPSVPSVPPSAAAHCRGSRLFSSPRSCRPTCMPASRAASSSFFPASNPSIRSPVNRSPVPQ